MIDTVSVPSSSMKFDESASEDMKMLGLLKELYVAREHPFLTSSRDGYTFLIIPQTVVKLFPIPDAKSIAAET